jgi:hypothetical protein
MNVRLTPLVVGVALAAAGVLLLLRNIGVLPAGITVWPVLLIAVGAVLLIAGLQQRSGEDAPAEAAAVPLNGARAARLVLQHGAGVLDVSAAAGPGHLFDGTFAGGVRHEVQRRDDRLEVTLRHPADPERLIRQSRGLRWSVALTREVPVDLEVRTGASRVRLDLDAVQLGDLRVQTGASEVDVRLPSRGRSRVRVSAGAAEVRLHVPQGVAASITTRSALASGAASPRASARYMAWLTGKLKAICSSSPSSSPKNSLSSPGGRFTSPSRIASPRRRLR